MGKRIPLGRGPGANRRIYLPVSSSPGEGFSASFTLNGFPSFSPMSSKTDHRRLRGEGKPRLDPGDICHVEFVIDLTTRRTGRPA